VRPAVSDVFLSYARENESTAKIIARAIEARGWSVFWDRRIVPGDHWVETVERELHTSACVVVLWSAAAVSSRWVRNEARYAVEHDVLVPVCLDATGLPVEFSDIQCAQLNGRPGVDDPRLLEVIEALGRHIASKGAAPRHTAKVASSGSPAHSWMRQSLKRRPWIPAAAAATAAVAIALYLVEIQGPGSAPQHESPAVKTVETVALEPLPRAERYSGDLTSRLVGRFAGYRPTNGYVWEIRYSIEFRADGTYTYSARQQSPQKPFWKIDHTGRYVLVLSDAPNWTARVELQPNTGSGPPPTEDDRTALVDILGLPDERPRRFRIRPAPPNGRFTLQLDAANPTDLDQTWYLHPSS
jgi:hypothetical protein